MEKCGKVLSILENCGESLQINNYFLEKKMNNRSFEKCGEVWRLMESIFYQFQKSVEKCGELWSFAKKKHYFLKK